MRTLMLSLSLLVAIPAVASADGVDGAHQRLHAQEIKLDYESRLVVIADRDLQTARLEQDTARNEIDRAQTAGNTKQLVYWSHRLETAHADERDAMQRYEKHVGMREGARKQLRVAAADVKRLEALEASR